MTFGYVTIAEADEYVRTHYLSTDATRLAWEQLSDEDKAVLLIVSFEAIEQLVYRGRRTAKGQKTAYPRYPDTEVPTQVKHAQIANAVVIADPEYQKDVDFYNKLKSFGIKSYQIGNLSESLGASWSNNGGQGVYSQEALRLLQPYLQGGFRII